MQVFVLANFPTNIIILLQYFRIHQADLLDGMKNCAQLEHPHELCTHRWVVEPPGPEGVRKITYRSVQMFNIANETTMAVAFALQANKVTIRAADVIWYIWCKAPTFSIYELIRCSNFLMCVCEYLCVYVYGCVCMIHCMHGVFTVCACVLGDTSK